MSAATADSADNRKKTAAPFLLATQSVAQRRRNVCGILLVLLLGTILFSAENGPANIPYGTVARLLLNGFGMHVPVNVPPDELASDMVIVNTIRLPRILVGV